MQIPKIIQRISQELVAKKARAVMVGGAVRDHFMGVAIKDYDIEVYGLESLQELEGLLMVHGTVNLVGKSFGILKFRYEKNEYDFSFPRTEEKSGIGHRGFHVQCDGSLSFDQASLRRDFTINAMGYDIEAQSFLDPHHGQVDMETKVLRHIDEHTFIEDPLRVYRAVQFCARFEYTLAPKTFQLCRRMVEQGMLEELPKERVYEEFKKLLLKSANPSMGLNLMHELGMLRYFPELQALIGIPQSPKWHPEGDVWTHTLLALDQMAKRRRGEAKQDLKLMLAVLCHDLGKATHTQITAEKITSVGHEEAGVTLTRSFLSRLTNEHDLMKSVAVLVREHMRPTVYFHNKAKDKTIRKLATRVNIQELVMVARADNLGRTTPEALSGIYPAGDWLLGRAKALDVLNEPPKPLLYGRDLLELGLKPSREFKQLLELVYSGQIEGKINNKNEALSYIRGLKGLS